MGQCPLCTSKKGNIIITDIILSQNDPIIHSNTNNISMDTSRCHWWECLLRYIHFSSCWWDRKEWNLQNERGGYSFSKCKEYK